MSIVFRVRERMRSQLARDPKFNFLETSSQDETIDALINAMTNLQLLDFLQDMSIL